MEDGTLLKSHTFFYNYVLNLHCLSKIGEQGEFYMKLAFIQVVFSNK